MAAQVTQDPAAHVPYEVDWSIWLAARGYTASQIANSTGWTQTGSPVTITQQSISGPLCTVWVKNVLAGKTTTLRCTIVLTVAAGGMPITDVYKIQLFGATSSA